MPGLAMVTGASSGIGEAYAERLAADGSDLMIVARRVDRLNELAARLRNQHRVNVDAIGADLGRTQDVAKLCEAVADAPVDMLVNNAGLAYYMPFASHPGITIKLHSTTLYNSIFWFDDDMLVNTHVYGVPAHFAPVLHLRHLSSGTLFQTYARSFDRVWDQTRKTFTGTEKL